MGWIVNGACLKVLLLQLSSVLFVEEVEELPADLQPHLWREQYTDLRGAVAGGSQHGSLSGEGLE